MKQTLSSVSQLIPQGVENDFKWIEYLVNEIFLKLPGNTDTEKTNWVHKHRMIDQKLRETFHGDKADEKDVDSLLEIYKSLPGTTTNAKLNWIKLHDELKDVLKRFSKNVSSQKIKESINSHFEVQEGMVRTIEEQNKELMTLREKVKFFSDCVVNLNQTFDFHPPSKKKKKGTKKATKRKARVKQE